jgi:hypothetical protein
VGLRVQVFELRVEISGFRVWNVGFQVQGSRCGAYSSDFLVQGLRFRVQEL